MPTTRVCHASSTYRLGYDHTLSSAALGIFASELQRDFRRRAERVGVDSAGTGGVTFIQRHGSALNLNVHFHRGDTDGSGDAAAPRRSKGACTPRTHLGCARRS